MELADEVDLFGRISQSKKNKQFLQESDIWKVFSNIVRGLKSLHDMQILHRDLKSANVFLFKDGSAKLGDLNVSKVSKRGVVYTQTGTPYYASPEVWKDQPYDSKSDIWSLGCVLYEMMSLRPPFRAQDMKGLYEKVTSGQIGRMPDHFSAEIQKMVYWLLNVNPEQRPTCDNIINSAIFKKKQDFFNDEDSVCSTLMKTIKVPKNLMSLSNRLPEPNYESSGKIPRYKSQVNIHSNKKDNTVKADKNKSNSSLVDIDRINNKSNSIEDESERVDKGTKQKTKKDKINSSVEESNVQILKNKVREREREMETLKKQRQDSSYRVKRLQELSNKYTKALDLSDLRVKNPDRLIKKDKRTILDEGKSHDKATSNLKEYRNKSNDLKLQIINSNGSSIRLNDINSSALIPNRKLSPLRKNRVAA